MISGDPCSACDDSRSSGDPSFLEFDTSDSWDLWPADLSCRSIDEIDRRIDLVDDPIDRVRDRCFDALPC